jgi:hypothetical protein
MRPLTGAGVAPEGCDVGAGAKVAGAMVPGATVAGGEGRPPQAATRNATAATHAFRRRRDGFRAGGSPVPWRVIVTMPFDRALRHFIG